MRSSRLVERHGTRSRLMNVTLREISSSTVRRITGLQVAEAQRRFVASNAVSLAEALFSDSAWYRAVYLGEEPAGFVMLRDESLLAPPPAAPRIELWRFMVDVAFQGRGVGHAALDQVVAHVRSKGLFRILTTSYVPGPGCPEPFYRRHGFRPTGEVKNGEIRLAMSL